MFFSCYWFLSVIFFVVWFDFFYRVLLKFFFLINVYVWLFEIRVGIEVIILFENVYY